MSYEPDIATLRNLKMVVCAGEWSHGQLARRAAQALADDLSTHLFDMPGNHLGPSAEAPAFAVALRTHFA